MLPLLKMCLQNLRQTLHGLEAGCVVLGVFIVGCRVPDGGDMSLVKSSFAFGLDAVAVVDRTAGISVMTEY